MNYALCNIRASASVIGKAKLYLSNFFDVESRVLLENSSWLFVANAVFVLCNFIQAVILGRSLGVELFGTYTLLLVFVETVTEFLNLNVDAALVKYVSEYRARNEINKVVAFVKGSYLFVGISAIVNIFVIAVLCSGAGMIFSIPDDLQIYALILAFGKSSHLFDNLSSSLLRVYDRFRLNSIIRITLAIVELATISSIAYFYPKNLPTILVGVFVCHLLGGLIRNGAAWLECQPMLIKYRHESFSLLKGQWREIRNFVLTNSGSRTIKVLHTRGDLLILGAFSSPQQVAYYSVAKKFASTILLLVDPVYSAIYPQLARLLAKRRFREVEQMLRKLSIVALIPLSIMLFVIIGWNEQIVTSFFGEEYRSVGKPLVILVLAIGIGALFFWLAPLLMSLGLTILRLKVDICVLAAGSLAGIILAPIYGAVGAALALLLVYLLSHSIFLYYIRKEMQTIDS